MYNSYYGSQLVFMEQSQYESYRKLGQKDKMRMINEASQQEKWRKQNPQGVYKFRQQDFIAFEVYQDKLKLNLKTYRHYKSDDLTDAVGLVFMFHGLNSHIGHGAHIAQALARNNFITVGFDHRGFGQSPGQKGYVQSLQSHIHDALCFTRKVKSLYPDLPAFALGLSMGGMTSYYLSLRYKDLFKGVVLMAPAIKNIVNGYMITFVTGLASLFHKKFKVPVKPRRGQATRNPAITEDMLNDPHTYTDSPCIKTIEMLIGTMKVTPSTFSDYDANFVIVQGGLDKLVHPDGAFQLYDKCKSTDKTIWFYEQMWHDIWHEQEIVEIIQKTVQWLTDRLPSKPVVQHQIKVITESPPSFQGGFTETEVTYQVETVTESVEIQEIRSEIKDNVKTAPLPAFMGGFTGKF